MARHEIYSSQINIDIQGVSKGIAQVTALRDEVIGAVADINKAFSGLKSIKIDTSGIDSGVQNVTKSVKGIGKAFKDPAFDKEIFELQSRIKNLADKSSPEFLRLQRDFSKVKESFADAGKGLASEQATKGLEDLQKRVQDLGQEAQETAQKEIVQLGQKFDEIGNIARESTAGIGQSFTNVRDGIRLARAEGGSLALGLRTAFFGVGESTNLLARGLGFLTRDLSKVGRLQDDFSKAGARIAEQVAQSNIAFERQANVLADVASRSGIAKSAFNPLRREMDVVANSFEKVARAAAKGEDTTKAIQESEQAASNLKLQIDILRQTEITDPAQLRLLDQLEKELEQNANATKVLAVNARQQKIALDAAKKAEKEAEKQAKETARAKERLAKDTKEAGQSARNATGGVNSLNRELRETRTVAAAASDVFRGVFSGAFLGTFAGNALRDLSFGLREAAGEMTNLAAEAEELENKFNVVFQDEDGTIGGKLAAGVNAQLEEIGRNFRRSTFDLATQAANFQDTFIPLGFSRENASQLSVALTALTQDLSSFYNVSTDEAAERLSSTLVGNYENMRRFGVVINDAALNQEFLNQGLDITTRTANQQQKTMAVLSLIMNGVQDAQGDLSRSGEEYTNQLRALDSVSKDLKIELGETLKEAFAPFVSLALEFATTAGPGLVASIKEAIEPIKNFAIALAEAIGSGNISNLTAVFQDLIGQALDNVIDYLNGFIDVAFSWGESFVVEIANGMFAAIEEIIAAVVEIGNAIASFLAPGSPPERGPLSGIDQWASGLVDTFNSGFEAADFDFLENTLKSISDAFTEQNFGAIKDGLVGLVDEINRTGDFNEASFKAVAEQIGEGNKEQIKTLELQLEYQKARKQTLDLEKEVAAAEKAGFVPKALRDKLNAAKAEEQQNKKNLDLQQKFLEFQDLSFDDFKKNVAETARAASNLGKASSRAIKEAINKNLEFINKGYHEELALLERKFALGLISEEEYLKERIKLEKKYADARLEEGLGIFEDTVPVIEELEARLKQLQDAAKGGGTKDERVPDINSILGDYLTRSGALTSSAKATIENLGGQLGTSISTAFSSTLQEKLPAALDEVGNSFKDRFTALLGQVRTLLSGPQGLLVGAIGGLGAQIAFSKLGNVLAPIAARILPILKNWRLLLGIGLRWTLIGTAAVLVFQNWDKILAVWNIVVEAAKDAWSAFLDNFGGSEKFFADAQAAFEDVKNFLDIIKTGALDVVALFEENDIVEKLKGFLGGSFSDILGGDFENIPQRFKELLEAFPSAQEILSKFKIENVDLSNLASFVGNTISAIGETVGQAIISVIGQENFDNLIAAFDGIKAGIASIFAEGTAGGEFALLLQDLRDLGIELLPIIKGIGIAIGGLLAVALNIVVSATQAFIDVLPFLEQILAGLIRTIRGVIQFFTGLAIGIRGVFEFIIALFTGGDIDAARETLAEGFAGMVEGISNILAGLYQAVINILFGILAFLTSFGSNFINNITRFLGEGAQEFGAKAIEFKDKFIAGIRGLSSQIRLIIVLLIARIKEIFTADTLKEGADLVLAKIVEVKDAILNFFTEISNFDLTSFLEEDLPAIIEDIRAFLTDLGETFGNWLLEEAPFFQTEFGQGLVDFVSDAIGYLRDNGEAITSNLNEFLKQTVENALAYVKDQVVTWATDLYGNFNDWFNQTFDKTDEDAPTLGYRLGFIVGTIIENAIFIFTEGIPLFIEKFLGGINNIFTGGIDEFENGAPDIATRLGEIVGVVVGGIFVFFTQTLPAWKEQLRSNLEEFLSSASTYVEENKEQIAQDIWDGIKNAFQTVLDLFSADGPRLREELSTRFSEMLTGAIESAKQKVPEPLRNLIGLETDEVVSDANNTADQLGSAFSTVGDDIAKPVEEGTEKSKGFFQGLYDAVWGDSIVPDMIAGITLGFTNMSVSLDAIVNNMILMMQNSFMRLFTFVTQNTIDIQVLWTTATTLMSQAIILLEQQALVSFEIIRTTIQIVIDTLKSLNDEILKTIELIAELAGLDLSGILDAFEKLEDSMQRTRKLAKEFAKFMKDAQDSAGAIGDDLGGNFAGDGGGGGFQGGLFRVPRTMNAIVHQDELIANKPVAEALRSLFSALELHGIGSEAFSLRGQGAGAEAGPQNNYITANFPNVSSAREADGIVDALNSLIDRGRAFARAGG